MRWTRNAARIAKIRNASLESEVLAAVVMTSFVFWDITPCRVLRLRMEEMTSR
jgi:hypothetical protein